jgi:hypothetical protein
MTPLAVGIPMLGGGPITHFEVIVFLLAAGAVIFVGICWGIVEELAERTHGRKWPTVSAVVDIVSVTFVPDDTPSMRAYPDLSYYLATLTYVYRNPELQMGDYSRRFGNEGDAKAGANSYKGSTVAVHVDSRDPTRSLLRKEDL